MAGSSNFDDESQRGKIGTLRGLGMADAVIEETLGITTVRLIVE